MGWQDDYEPVETRLARFHEQHPYGRITTELLHHEGGDYIVKATVWRGDEIGSTPPAATGLAHDSADLLPANMKASALEVCETSAVGRALANLGFAPKGARPSREEMQKASPVPQPQGENAPIRGATGVSPADDPEPVRAPDSLGESSAGATSEGDAGVRHPKAGSAPATPSATSEAVSGGEYGEGSTPAPASDEPFLRVVKVAGSRAKAREAINRVCDLEYTAKTMLQTTDEEADITIAALQEGE